MDLSHGHAYSSHSTYLDFTPTPRPIWRPADLPSTMEMLDEVASTAAAGSFVSLPQKAIQLLASMYVVESNRQELVGTEDMQSTLDIVDGLVSTLPIQQQRETRNTLNALTFLHTVQSDMVAAGHPDNSDSPVVNQLLLTMDVIAEVHKHLMQGLHPDAGRLRSSTTCTLTDTGIYIYAAPDIVPSALQSLVDQHNFQVERRFSSCTQPTKDDVLLLFNLAAQQALRLFTIHPFADGNGRLGRLLVNFILRPAIPFPVRMTPPYVSRQQYITAVHSARNVTSSATSLKHPCDLAAMIIEGAWFSIRDATTIMAQLTANSRGELFVCGPTITRDRYQRLHSIDLSPEEQEKELQLLQTAAARLWEVGSGEVVVALLHNTTCKLWTEQ